MANPHILSFGTYDDWDSDEMNDLFTVHSFPDIGNPDDITPAVKEQIRAFAFKGHHACGPEVIDAFPNLGLISNYGVGYDAIDVAHAAGKGIHVTNTPDVLTDDVADLTVGMLLTLTRDIIGASQWVRSGDWSKVGAYPLQRTLSGASVGIAGLGRIGRAIATRLQVFNTTIHYYSRIEKDTPGWKHHSDLVSLAKACDVLVIAVSGGPDTKEIISSDVIAALGSDSVLVNISRGSTVDEEALISALQNNELRGAALDVFNNEPDIDARFLKLENVLLQPHQASATVETRKAMGKLQRDNLIAYFADKPLLTPVVA